MITVKNSQLDNDTMTVLSKFIDADITATSAFKLMRIIKELSSIIDDKSKLEKRIFDKWVEKGEDGNPTKVTNENGEIVQGAVKIIDINSFNSDMNELMSIENKINFSKIKFEDLGLETAKIKDLIKIDFLFE
jgi:hypothetical protein